MDKESSIGSEINELKIFAQGLENDIVSIRNALIFDYNNGILEGNINRLKMIKRIMYGSGRYDLLSKRVLYAF
jgi:transposase